MKKDLRIKYNLISSILYQVVFVSISFLLPRLYLENFGSDVNGVLSTIKQIFMYMILLEAGVGLATTQALYKPIGEGDQKSAGAILAATDRYYKKTGVIYLAIVLVIAAVYSFCIPTAVEPMVLFVLILLNALPALFSYFIQAKYRILMEVDGRRYVINNSETVAQLLANLGKVLVLLLTDSLILIQLVYCIVTLLQLAYLYAYAKKRYAWLDLSQKPDYNAISQRGSVLVHQLSAMVFNNTDVLLISMLCDFKTVSIYAIYTIFFTQMQSLIQSVVSGFTFKLGQMFQIDREKFQKVFKAYEMAYIMGTFLVFTLMAVFVLPVIQIYTKGINDTEYSNALLVFLFSVMQLLSNGKMPVSSVAEYAGRFEETRKHAIWEMIINLTVSVVCIKLFGICGAIFGTILALTYRNIVMIDFTNRKILERSSFETYRFLLINGGVFALAMCIFYVDAFSFLSFGSLVVRGLIHGSWIFALFVLANYIFGRGAFETLLALCRKKEI